MGGTKNRHRTLILLFLALAAFFSAALILKAIFFRLNSLPNIAEILPAEGLEWFYVTQSGGAARINGETTFAGTFEETTAYKNIRSRLPYLDGSFFYGTSASLQSLFAILKIAPENCKPQSPDLTKLLQISPYFAGVTETKNGATYAEIFFAVDKILAPKVDSATTGIPETVDTHCQLEGEKSILSTQKFFDDGLLLRVQVTTPK